MIEKMLDPLPQPVRLMLTPWLANFFPQGDAFLLSVCEMLAHHRDQELCDLLRKFFEESGWYDFDQHVTENGAGRQNGIR